MSGAAPNPVGQSPHTTLSMLLRTAGFPASEVPKALGVIDRESTRDPKAINTKATCSTKGDRAVGLMQVCTVHCGSSGLSSDKAKCTQQLQDPLTNLRVAHGIWASAGNSFARDWPETANGAVGKDGVILAGGQAAGDPIGTAASAVGNVFGSVTDFLNWLTNPSSWLRVGKGFLGVVLIVGGVYALVFTVANKASGGNAGKLAAAAVTKKIPT